MKSFQFFKEDSEQARERQLQSLEDLTTRREKAKAKSVKSSGSFKKRSKGRLQQIISRHQEINLDYQKKRKLAKKKAKKVTVK